MHHPPSLVPLLLALQAAFEHVLENREPVRVEESLDRHAVRDVLHHEVPELRVWQCHCRVERRGHLSLHVDGLINLEFGRTRQLSARNGGGWFKRNLTSGLSCVICLARPALQNVET